jgi:hypothetical protein
LEAVIEEAAETIKKIEILVENYCKSNVPHDKQKEECKDLVEASAYSIKPQYEVLRKKELFAGISLSIKALSWPMKSTSTSRNLSPLGNWSMIS